MILLFSKVREYKYISSCSDVADSYGVRVVFEHLTLSLTLRLRALWHPSSNLPTISKLCTKLELNHSIP